MLPICVPELIDASGSLLAFNLVAKLSFQTNFEQCHKFGGMYVQKFVEVDAKPVSAAVMMCSVPPSGNAAIVSRFIR